MNYILSQINRKIEYLESAGKKNEARVHYQAKFEFILNFILGYLWNKNWHSLTPDDKEYVINCILKPSIGSIIAISRKLDVGSEFFGNRKLKKFYTAIDEYPNLRNERIGHGFSFEDDTDDMISNFQSLISKIEEADIDILALDCDIVFVEHSKGDIYFGTNFKPDGATYIAWTCPKQVQAFESNSLYLLKQGKYFRISPFIHMEGENDLFIFCSIEDKLIGRVKYNKLIRTGRQYVDIPELQTLNISNDGHKIRTSNGTVINSYQNNYKKYIDVGISNKILSFLTNNKSSVFATLWGHGGVGKTASIQHVCEILTNKQGKEFDYIVFLSAKDRFYNYYQGEIQRIEESILTLDQIINYINNILSNYSSPEIDPILNFSGKLLIVIDDLETFSKVEKDNITSFIKKLNINHHKVIITTRAATLVTGEEIQTKELGEDETIKFLESALQNEIPDFNSSSLKKDLKNSDFRKRIYEITSGRPLFILQFTILLGQKSNLNETLIDDIKSTEAAKNFLYDRIYNYLSPVAKNMFLAISLLVTEDDLSGLVDSLKFVLNKEDNDEEFQNCLNELIKLKILVLEDKEFYKVYSPEIYKYMKFFYEKKDGDTDYDSVITTRFVQISANRDLDTELALLETADASKMFSSEEDVENKYRFIINRDKTTERTKIKAILNLANYLFTFKGKEDKTNKLFTDFYHKFNTKQEFVKAYATFCWTVGTFEKKLKAIEILKNFLETKPQLDTEAYYDFLGTLITYSSIQLINEREELKDAVRFGEISKEEYAYSHQLQKDRFYQIYSTIGMRLFKKTRDFDLMYLSPNCRNAVLNGLTHFVEICIRVNKREIGKEVCNKIISELPENYHHPFIFRIKKIEMIEHPERKIDLFRSNTETAIGSKLKQAMFDKRKKEAKK
ncbi:NB-ARC domain-containing protein [Mucilaginibacter phyllosphaerae]|uniref:NB-ARC domain-containing protein n=1 Tax=Mucilaginibacter phyllosphaerae TaxID=1812349 RepID=A0A4Y8ABI0_9SPHI|nr:NB-ARC domain-containing protein [Mucilaginibacter phyllosphaerae]MBB3969908.1 hypothetical protein [Mucilaginibacter phyllosphaerae]TEW65282.1 hypothetical protein E2R65_15330 [Mucilaginibacter phyllosphaerae]GGH16862.1 hypothetical protein GCM10007352_26550 [Mucilaginibacter phyllosphaerae]